MGTSLGIISYEWYLKSPIFSIHGLLRHLHLSRGLRHPPNECLRYDSKQSDGEVPVMHELWGIQGTPSLTSLTGPLYPGVVVPDRFLFMGPLKLNYVLIENWILCSGTIFDIETVLTLIWIVWHLTVCKQKLYFIETVLVDLELYD